MRSVALVLILLLLGGCVERDIQLRSTPPGAEAYVDGEYVGVTPCAMSFDFYGTREVELRKEGYQVLRELEKVSVPLYERFPLDFFSEVVLPVRLKDSHVFSYTLEVLPSEEEGEQLYERAREFRSKAEEGEDDEGGRK
jgi:hypothetical protein